MVMQCTTLLRTLPMIDPAKGLPAEVSEIYFLQVSRMTMTRCVPRQASRHGGREISMRVSAGRYGWRER